MAFPLTIQLGIILAIVVLCVVSYFGIAGAISDYQYHKQVQKLEQAFKDKDEKYNTLDKKQKSLEAQVKEQEKVRVDLEEKEKSARDEIAKKEAEIAKLKRSRVDTQRNYQNNVKKINEDIDAFTRCNRMCDSSASAGYPCAPNLCSQFKN